MNFDVIPAIDLRGGRAVRLWQGDYARETVFADGPVALARGYAAAGARWLHVVDLDGARSGSFGNLDTLTAIAQIPNLQIQAGGGVRTAADVQRLLAVGVARVVVGSVAVRAVDATIGWIRAFGADRIVPALDARFDGVRWRLPVDGWTRLAAPGLEELARAYAVAGARQVLCTDIGRDGTFGGFNLALYRQLHAWAPGLRVIASGGASSLADIQAARAEGVGGVVLGRALLEGAFLLREALAC